jgi:hypothetical protein
MVYLSLVDMRILRCRETIQALGWFGKIKYSFIGLIFSNLLKELGSKLIDKRVGV